MDIKPDRMVSLGYGKYWRSDDIVGLRPIDEDRGPGRRTEVYTSNLSHPLVASRSERAILRDMATASDEMLMMEEVREVLDDLLDALGDVPDVLKRMLGNEVGFNVDDWSRRVRTILRSEATGAGEDQNDLFP